MNTEMLHLPTRQIGHSSLKLPIFGFGAAHLGELYAPVPEAQAVATLKAAWEAGIRYFDTAPLYGNGLSEHRVGNFLRQQERAAFLLSTKVGILYSRPADINDLSAALWQDALPFLPHFDYSYDGIMRSYEHSLMRLSLNTVNALTIHNLDRVYHADPAVFDRHWRDLEGGGLKALQELKSSGQIRAIGAGINQPDLIPMFVERCNLDYLLVAMPYTLLDQTAAEPGGGFDLCASKNVSVVIGSPYASGILADPERLRYYAYAPASPQIIEKVEKLLEVCKEYGVSLKAAALQFVLAHPVVASVIPGAVEDTQVRDNARNLRESIPVEFWDALRERKLILPNVPIPKGNLGA